MVRVVLLLGLAALAVARAERTVARPTVKHINLEKVYGALAAVEKSEFQLLEQVFALAQQEIQVAVRAQANATRTQASAPAGAPAGAPDRGPEGGDRIPATGPAWTPPEHLKAVTPDLKATAQPKFVPLCAAKIEEMVQKNAAFLAKHGASNDTIGLSLATHFQVVCEGAFPLKEQQCDDTSVQLAKLVDSGNPLNPAGPAGAPGAPGGAPGAAPAAALASLRAKVRAAAPAAAPGGAPGGPGGPTDSGPAWCTAFFGLYFDGVVAANAAAGPAR